MNGAVYISFFQGQLESVLEQVVQLAVQEISKTVGSSLNGLLLETAVKEQENHRLRVQLQSWETRGRANASCSDGGSSLVVGRNKAGRPAGDEATDSGRTKPEQPQRLHAPGGQGTEPGLPTDTRRLDQRGRVVDQLKSVMEQVLNFAVRELTKIVEASFDDLLLEITKMEREHQVLEERLDKSSSRGGGGEKGRAGRRRGSENDSVSPSGSEDAREELAEVPVSKQMAETDPERPSVISVSQDWFPILDKVFGQKWCSDVWQIKELAGAGRGGRSVSEGGAEQMEPPPAPSVTLEPSPSSPQQDPRWTPLEDMEVFSPDDDATDGQTSTRRGDNATTATTGPPRSPTGGGGKFTQRPAAHFSGSSGRRSSASMLHRLLTLPSQLLEEEDEDAGAKETLAALASDGANDCPDDAEPSAQTCLSPLTTREEDEEEEEEEEDKGRKKKRRRVWSECDECGRRFSRMSLLKAHRQTHFTEIAGADTSSPSSPPDSATPALRCSDCGKRFSSATRLHSHIRTQHPGNRA
ncbi:uncharacterized protein si:dkeyp-113d7.10 isoform X2 [Hippoglossus hippoglossus]|uniref:uncharacterized protein si:dkeyp-113d7.10 isoform X2 n=1 Tax=Hippoglossus hippoglossus TaxID=8267 RepID=UPI00148E50F1|nr:uncharacterized protein si:dkeyp-113d7.10 isoform X2 [Hippoglossus hippoglossus]